MNRPNRRRFVTTVAALAGFAAMVGYLVLAKPPGPPPPPGEFDPVVFEAMFLFLTTAFTVGAWLYRLLGDQPARQIVRATAAQHVPFLHVAAGSTLLAMHGRAALSGRGAAGDAALTIAGLGLVTIGLPGVVRAIRTYRSSRRPPPEDPGSA